MRWLMFFSELYKLLMRIFDEQLILVVPVLGSIEIPPKFWEQKSVDV